MEKPNMAQCFHVQWNNHPTYLVEEISSLFKRQALVDVSLVCDNQTFMAHKIVLAACSEVFEALFMTIDNLHPIVYLKGVNYMVLMALVQFMYKGEVNVDRKLLPLFLKEANALKIRGLTDSNVKMPDPQLERFTHELVNSLDRLPSAKRGRKSLGACETSITERFQSDSQPSSQCSYTSPMSVLPKSLVPESDMPDIVEVVSPVEEIKQELDVSGADYQGPFHSMDGMGNQVRVFQNFPPIGENMSVSVSMENDDSVSAHHLDSSNMGAPHVETSVPHHLSSSDAQHQIDANVPPHHLDEKPLQMHHHLAPNESEWTTRIHEPLDMSAGCQSSKGAFGGQTSQSSRNIIPMPENSMFLSRKLGITNINQWNNYTRHWPEKIPCPTCHAVLGWKDYLQHHLRVCRGHFIDFF